MEGLSDPPSLPNLHFSFLLAFMTSPSLDLTGVSEVEKLEKLALNLLKLRLAFSLSLFFSALMEIGK